jgi:hypothetical protein
MRIARGVTGSPPTESPHTTSSAVAARRWSTTRVLAAKLEPPPDRLGVTHWSSRLLGKHLGIEDATVARAWRKYHVKPWRRDTFKFSTDPELEAGSVT